MPAATLKKKGPGPKFTASDSAKAVLTKRRATNQNNSLGVVANGYAKNYPGQDPFRLASHAKPPVPGAAVTHEMDVQRRQVQDTTLTTHLNQARNARLNKVASGE